MVIPGKGPRALVANAAVGSRVTRLAVGGEGALAAVALGWMAWRDLPLTWGPPRQALLLGGGTALLCAAINIGLLRFAPSFGPIESVRRVYRELLQPLFGALSRGESVVVSLAAGIGEELLFRGALQPEIGLVPASIVFGALHWGGSGTLAFAVGATLLGLVLGGLVLATGGLLAAIVAHAFYDTLVLAYIRRAQRAEAVV